MAQATIATTVIGLQGHAVSNTVPVAGQALVFNGTQWAPDATTYLKTAGGTVTGSVTLSGAGTTLTAPAAQINGALGVTGAVTLGGNTTSTGNITTSGNISTTGSGSVQTPGNAGLFLNGAGTNIVSGRMISSSQGANQYPSLTATSPVQFGFNCTGTPRTSGRVLTMMTGRFASIVAQISGLAHVLSYGTGTAPGQGATGTGTTFGFQNYTVSPVASDGTTLPVALMAIAVALTVGTAYWFDMQVWIGASGQNVLIGNSILISAEY